MWDDFGGRDGWEDALLDGIEYVYEECRIDGHSKVESVMAWSSLSDWCETRGTEMSLYTCFIAGAGAFKVNTVSSLPCFWPPHGF